MSPDGAQPATVEHSPCISGARPLRVGWLAALDVVVVVAVLDHLAFLVEPQHGCSRERELLSTLCPTGPPLDRGSVARRDRLSEPALNVLLRRKLLTEVAADPGQTRVRLAERRRSVDNGVGVQRNDGLSISFWPRVRPGISPASGGRRGIYLSDFIME
jgi:hypothetical protein